MNQIDLKFWVFLAACLAGLILLAIRRKKVSSIPINEITTSIPLYSRNDEIQIHGQPVQVIFKPARVSRKSRSRSSRLILKFKLTYGTSLYLRRTKNGPFKRLLLYFGFIQNTGIGDPNIDHEFEISTDNQERAQAFLSNPQIREILLQGTHHLKSLEFKKDSCIVIYKNVLIGNYTYPQLIKQLFEMWIKVAEESEKVLGFKAEAPVRKFWLRDYIFNKTSRSLLFKTMFFAFLVFFYADTNSGKIMPVYDAWVT